MEADLGEHFHHLGPGERFGQKDGVRVFRAHVADQIFPKRHRLGVRIVHSEGFHAMFAPEQDDAGQFLPQLAPVFVLVVERVDVLILFGRVFGVFDRAVGPLEEPLGMRGDIRVVGRTVQREIQRDFHPALVDLRHEPVEVLECAEFRRHVFVASAVGAFLMAVADGIRHPGFVRRA